MPPIRARKIRLINIRFVEIGPRIGGPFAERSHILVGEKGSLRRASGGVAGREDDGDDCQGREERGLAAAARFVEREGGREGERERRNTLISTTARLHAGVIAPTPPGGFAFHIPGPETRLQMKARSGYAA